MSLQGPFGSEGDDSDANQRDVFCDYAHTPFLLYPQAQETQLHFDCF